MVLEAALDQMEEVIDEPEFVDIVFIVAVEFDDIVDASWGIEFFVDLDLELLLVLLDDLEVLEAADASALTHAVQSQVGMLWFEAMVWLLQSKFLLLLKLWSSLTV